MAKMSKTAKPLGGKKPSGKSGGLCSPRGTSKMPGMSKR